MLVGAQRTVDDDSIVIFSAAPLRGNGGRGGWKLREEPAYNVKKRRDETHALFCRVVSHYRQEQLGGGKYYH